MPSFPIHVSDACPFPLENLPLGIYSRHDSAPRICTAIGDYVLDLSVLESEGSFRHISEKLDDVFSQRTLNTFAALPKAIRKQVRQAIAATLQNSSSIVYSDQKTNRSAFHLMDEVQMHVPFDIPEYTDFSCYEEHVSNACKMNGMPMLPNFYHNPIAYNGRTSSIVISGTDIPRPRGVYLNFENKPEFQPCAKLDYELEMGIIISQPLRWGRTLTPDEALDEHVFGYVLLNDWSARDIQGYESIPVGPLNSKSFGTSMSAWVVLPDALEPFKTSPLHQRMEDAAPHLRHKTLDGTIYNIEIDCYVTRDGLNPKKLSTTNFAHSYFSVGQIIAHRAVSGCGLRTGEVVAGGTMSSTKDVWPDKNVCHQACLWELSNDGKQEVPIVGGKFLEDGDTVAFEGWACGKSGRRIGFGRCVGKITPVV